MNVKERIMATYQRQHADRVPWVDFCSFPRGSIEREARNMGLGIWDFRWPYDIEIPHVTCEQKVGEGVTERTYHTPKGSVKVKWSVKLGVGGAVHSMVGAFYPFGFRSSLPLPWIIEHLIKSVDDYEVVKFMIEDTIYVPNYKPLLESERHLGSDGIVMARVERSPVQKMFIQLMGVERFAIDFYKHQKEFNELYQMIEEKDKEAWRIAADSPAKIIWLGDNVDGVIIGPKIFEKYHLPYYNKLAQLLHHKGKVLTVHMDGRLKSLAPLIAKTEIDAIDSFNPPPVGDLSIAEARSLWSDKFIILINIPAPVYLLGEEATRKYTLELLRSIAPGDGWIIGLIEDVPYDALPMAKAVGSILQNAYLPLSLHVLDDLSKGIGPGLSSA